MDNHKKAIITGVTGQDGSYLAELLIKKGYEVHGIIRKSSTFNTQRINHIYKDKNEQSQNNLKLHYGNVTEYQTIQKLIEEIEPDEVYHLAAQSHVRASFDLPILTGKISGLGTTVVLEAIRNSKHNIKFYQASSSELYGSMEPPQDENTLMKPQSPYAIAKLYAYWMCRNYRDSYGLFASNGILFNHESPRRGERFVTRKITYGLTQILAGRQNFLYLGNLDAKRDWGYAPEFVEGMYKIIQYKEPDDFVLATGKSHSVKTFVKFCFDYMDLDYRDYVKIDKRYFRPTEVDHLEGNYDKAYRLLNWEPTIDLQNLAKIMVDADMELAGLNTKGEGLQVLKNSDYNWTTNELTLG